MNPGVEALLFAVLFTLVFSVLGRYSGYPWLRYTWRGMLQLFPVALGLPLATPQLIQVDALWLQGVIAVCGVLAILIFAICCCERQAVRP